MAHGVASSLIIARQIFDLWFGKLCGWKAQRNGGQLKQHRAAI
jgi:hypothetical protein